MSEKKQKNSGLPIYIILFVLIGLVGFIAYKKQNGSYCCPFEHNEQAAIADGNEPVVNISLADIIRGRQTWDVIMPDWMGKKVSDFTLTKLDGSQFTLSQNKGKNVLVVFWATWCIYCVHEIPHLNALIEDVPSSELAVIAISDESAEKVKSFSQSKGIKYDTAVSKPNFSDLPSPFDAVYRQGRPAAAFIDKQGRIKLMTIGKMSLTEIRKILQAETISSN